MRSLRHSLVCAAILGAVLFCAQIGVVRGQDTVAADSLFNAAYMLMQDKEFALARDGWNDFLQKYPTNSQADFALHCLGVCHFNLNEWDDAIRCFSQASIRENFSHRDESTFFLGRTYVQRAAHLPLVLAGQKKSRRANTLVERRRGISADAKREYENGIQAFKAAEVLFPDSLHRQEAEYWTGYALYQIGKPDDAIRYLEKVAQGKDPKHQNNARYLMCEVYLNLSPSRADRALEELEVILDNEPETSMRLRAQRLQADVLYQQKKFEQACVVFETIAKDAEFAPFLTPEGENPAVLNVANMRYRWGETLMKLKRYDEAAEVFRQITSDYKDSYYANYARHQQGLALKNMQNGKDETPNRLDQAATLWKQLLESNPQDEALRIAATHELAAYYLEVGTPEKAALLFEGINMRRAPALLLRDHADTLAALHKTDEAVAIYVQLFEDNQTPKMIEDAGDALYRAAVTCSAEKQYEKAFFLAEKLVSWDGFARLSASRQIRAQNELARAAYYTRRFLQAKEIWEQLATENPGSTSSVRWVLLAAKALRAAGDSLALVDFLDQWTKKIRMGECGCEKNESELNREIELSHLLGAAYRSVALDVQKKNPETGGSEAEEWFIKSRRAFVRAYNLFVVESEKTYRDADLLFYDLALTYHSLEDWEKCNKMLIRMAKRFKDSKYRDRMYFLRGQNYLAQEKHSLAARCFELLLEKCSDSPLRAEAALVASQCMLKLGDRKKAIEFTRQLENSAEYMGRGASIRALAAMKDEDYRTAMEAWEVVMNSDAPEMQEALPEAIYGVAYCKIMLGENEEAAPLLERLIQEFPDWSALETAFNQRVALYLNLKDSEKAADALAQMEKRFPESAFLRTLEYQLGLLLFQNENWNEAQRYFKKVSKKAERDEIYRSSILHTAWALFQAGKLDLCAESVQQVLADFVLDEGASEEEIAAQGAFRAEMQYISGLVCFEQKKREEALDFLLASRVGKFLKPEMDENAALLIIQVYDDLKYWNDLIAASEAFYRDFPESKELTRVRYKNAFALYMQTRLADALALCEIILESDDPLFVMKTLLLKGQALFSQNKYEDAIKVFYQVIYGVEEPELQADALYETAKCFEALGKIEQAKKHYRDLVDKFPESNKIKFARKKLSDL
ncbi:MAG: tetratricopeptide repeat protein [Planctomycetia bacterium]|nr:tetratricopeptide repeat protein [Planctomycetia bacterium]